MRSGSTPSSSRRSTRMVSTCVLPVPALALTQAEAVGSAAAAWSRRVFSRTAASPSGRTEEAHAQSSSPFVDQPLGNARQMGIVVVVVVEAGAAHGAIGRRLAIELGDQARQALLRRARERRHVIHLERNVLPRRLAARRGDVAQQRHRVRAARWQSRWRPRWPLRAAAAAPRRPPPCSPGSAGLARSCSR